LQHHPGAARPRTLGDHAAVQREQTLDGDTRTVDFSSKNQCISMKFRARIRKFAALHKKDLHFLESALK
jgi:hypothetical protein